MKSRSKNQILNFSYVRFSLLMLFLIIGSAACATNGVNGVDLKHSDMTTDGLMIVKTARNTEVQVNQEVNWSEYTKYQITPVDVSFRKNWQRDQNRRNRSVSSQITDRDMARMRDDLGKIVYEEFDKALKGKGDLKKVEEADSNTLLFKPVIINLDVYAPDVNRGTRSTTYMRQAGRGTLFLEVHDAVSGEILARWVDTREDPDNGYMEWANRVTNMARAKQIASSWARRLVEGLDKLQAAE